MNWSVRMRESIKQSSRALASRLSGQPLNVPALVLMANLVLVAGIGLYSARVFWLVVEPAGAVAPVLPHLARAWGGPAAAVAAPVIDRTRVTRFDPFGFQTLAQAVVAEAPETSLNLKLIGSRMTSGGDEGMAIIVTPDNKAGRYVPGAVLIEGVTLVSVLADRVLLSKNGQFETLYLSSSEGNLSVLTPAGEPPRGVRPTLPGVSAITSVLTPQALSQVSFVPVERDGAIAGYRLTNQSGGQDVLSGAGLQSGDIIVGLDGDPIFDFEPADLLDRMSGGSSVKLSIERDGRVFELSLGFEAGR
ncbi:type II secretion system protein N [Hyphomonas sp.]|uniref:type II secretion system protein N n=1 Tax=Hyphomonas sp. TaxID=87 RepID=UPI00391D63E6